ncbi:MAG TPA: MFS transporter [Methanomassiliicoccales archaeon]|nr:MFS transporter [Methanomassiliicoccales archaeon]
MSHNLVRLFTSQFAGHFDRRLWILFVGRIISATGFSIVMPFLSIYFYDQGISMTTIGLVFLVSAILGAVGQLLGGELADRLGRRRVMISSMGIRAVIFVLLSVVIASSGSFETMFVLVWVSNFVGAFFDPASNAMVADLCESSRRLEAYGLLRIGQNLGWTLGPLLAGVLIIMGYSTLFLLTAMTAFCVAFIILLFVSESKRSELTRQRFSIVDLAGISGDRQFMAFCVLSAVLFVCVAQMSSVYSVYSQSVVGVGLAEVGYLYAINGLMVVFIQMPVARVISHHRMTSAIAVGAILYAIGYFAVAFSSDFLTLALCMVVISMGEIVVSPASMNLVANLSPEDKRGRYMGVFGLFQQFGWSMGPFVGGILMDAFVGVPWMLWGGIAMFAFMSALGYFFLKGHMSEDKDRVGASPGD